MRRILNNPKDAIAAAGRQAFLWSREFLDRQTRAHEWIVHGATKSDSNGQFAFCQSVRDLPEITAQKKFLLHDFSQVFFPLGLPHKRPQRYARPANARVIQTDLALPFEIEKIVKRAQFVGLRQLWVIEKTFRTSIGDERIKKPVRLDVVVPNVAAPPKFGIFNLGENHVRVDSV